MSRSYLRHLLCAWSLLLHAHGMAGAQQHTIMAEQYVVHVPSPDTLRKMPLAAHPRLLAAAERFAALRDGVQSDVRLRTWYEAVHAQADALLADTMRPVYRKPDGIRLLATSQRVLTRVRTLGLVYQLTGDERYARRAWRELESAAKFPDWNPSHFLDAGEMAHAVALGLDWMYDVWSESERALLRDAILEKAFEPALRAYHGERGPATAFTPPLGWWADLDVEHNWNQVCNGGLTMAALAIMDVAPVRASEVLYEALIRLPRAMRHYIPDGAWNEGPGYWHYATSYNTFAIAALHTALGTDFGLASLPAFRETGAFPSYMTGPTRRSFNFADAVDRPAHGSEQFWLASVYGRPAYAQHHAALTRGEAMDVVWYDSATLAAPADAPLDRYFRGVELVSMRSAWNDPNAVFVAVKAGDNKANHSHLDLGTFVLDALGERWAVELGRDDYNLPGYFDKLGQRLTYYRTRSEGQNTLVINPASTAGQDPQASAQIVAFESTPAHAFTVTDLTRAYPGAQRVQRGVALINHRQDVLVQDEVELRAPGDLWWFMHTRAEVRVAADGRSAVLSQNGKQLLATLVSPVHARFTVMAARPLPASPAAPGQNPNDGIRKLAIHLSRAQNERITVLLTTTRTKPPAVPLAKWGETFGLPLDSLARRSLRYAATQLRHTTETYAAADSMPRSTLRNGRWKFSEASDWTSGFFPGLLWYMYQYTGDSYWRQQAAAWTAPMEKVKSFTHMHDLGFMVLNSFGHQYRLTGDAHARAVILEASRSLSTRFNPRVGAIRSWDFGSWQYPVIVDNMMNLEMLFWAARNGGDSGWKDLAVRHALTTMREHMRTDSSVFHLVDFDTTSGQATAHLTVQGYADSSNWARGQAWGLYGFTMAYRETRDARFLHAAQGIANQFLALLPGDRVPYWDLRHPHIPEVERDASAGAIAASALLELARHTGGATGRHYRAEAELMLRALATGYTTEGTDEASILRHGVGHRPAGGEVDVGLIYADYYFVEALLRYLDPAWQIRAASN